MLNWKRGARGKGRWLTAGLVAAGLAGVVAVAGHAGYWHAPYDGVRYSNLQSVPKWTDHGCWWSCAPQVAPPCGGLCAGEGDAANVAELRGGQPERQQRRPLRHLRAGPRRQRRR